MTWAGIAAVAGVAIGVDFQRLPDGVRQADRSTRLATPAGPDFASSGAVASNLVAPIEPPARSWRVPPPEPPDAEDPLAVDGYQHLIVNEALLFVFDHYLLRQAGPGDRADLLAHLQTRLPGPAFEDARPLVNRYADYMQAHDAQLAARWPAAAPPTELVSIAGWVAQRHQLRLSHLGPATTRAWFQNADAQLGQALLELAQRQALAGGDGAAEGATPVPHWESAAAEAQRVDDLQRLISKATTSYRAQRQRAAGGGRSDSVGP